MFNFEIKIDNIEIECPSCLKSFEYELEYVEKHYSIISPAEMNYLNRFVECEGCGESINLL